MPVVNTIQTNFTGGEFSPKMLARVDITRYSSGAQTLENVIVMPWGGARKRGGTRFIANTKNDNAVRLQEFIFSTTQAYCLEFGNSYVRFHTDDGTVVDSDVTITGATQANPVVITATAHGYSNGNHIFISGVAGMVELNNREFTVAGVTANTFQLSGVDGSAYTAYSSGGVANKIIETTTPYSASEIAALDFTQSADTLYIVHADHAPRKLVRNSATSWTLSEATIEAGPFRDINVDDTITLYLSGGSATSYGTYAEGDTGITMTASSALFTVNHVGSLWRLYSNPEGSHWSQLIADQTPVTINLLYENAGFVYAVTADSLVDATWQASMQLPTHSHGSVKIYNDADTSDFATFKYVHDGSVIVRVTAFTSTTEVTVTVERNDAPEEVIGSGNATAFWEEGAFSDERGWPSRITFFEERLWLAGSSSQPQTVWSSRTGAFLFFLDGPFDDDAITFTISSEQVDAVQWMTGGRTLSVGTTDGEYVISAASPGEPLTPDNITVKRQTRYGSADNVFPVRIGEVVLFGQRYGEQSNGARVIREHAYSFENDAYLGRNVTILSDHITGAGVTELAYQASPWSVLWALRSDGVLAALTYERDQEVLAWHRHKIGGVSDASNNDAIVESIAVVPGNVGDDLWMVVQRYVSGATVRHIERTTIGLDDDAAITASQFLDAHLVYSGSSTTTISGLWHLRGQTVRVFHSGADQGATAVSSGGVVTLGSAVTAAVIGYGYTAKVLSLRAEAGVASGTAQGKRKRISEATARLYQSYGGSYGGNATITDDITYDSVALFTGDKRLEWPDGWGYDAQFYFEQTTAYPFVLIGVIAEIRGSG